MSKRPLEKIEETLDISTLLWMLLYGSFPYPTAQQQIEEQIGNIDRIIEENPEQAKQGFTWLYRIGTLYRLLHVQPLWVDDILNVKIRPKEVKIIGDYAKVSDLLNYHASTKRVIERLEPLKTQDLLNYSLFSPTKLVIKKMELLRFYDSFTRLLYPAMRPPLTEQISFMDSIEKYISSLVVNTYPESLSLADGVNALLKPKTILQYPESLSLTDEILAEIVETAKRYSEYLTLIDEVGSETYSPLQALTLMFTESATVSDGQIQGYPYPEQPEISESVLSQEKVSMFAELIWLPGWEYRKLHEIIGSIAGAQTDYQVKIVVHYGSGVDNEEHVYLNGKCRTDFGDIRFTDSDGTTELSYWIEEKVDGDYAIFWVKIPNIPASPDKKMIYIYYGNPEAITTSDGEATFILFDDFDVFDESKWVVTHGPYPEAYDSGIVDGNFWMKGNGNISAEIAIALNSLTKFATPFAIRTRMKAYTYDAHSNYDYFKIGVRSTTSIAYGAENILFSYQPTFGASYAPPKISSLLESAEFPEAPTPHEQVYSVLELQIFSGHTRAYVDEQLVGELTGS